MDQLREFWQSFWTGLRNSMPSGDDLAWFLIQVIKVALIGTITLYAAQLIKRWVTRLLGRSRLAPNVIALTGNAIIVVVVVLGVSWLLAAFGASWTALLASLSVVTVAISLSLQ